LQKRQLVEVVREHSQGAITLAIGDGANDVSMIQGAHLGIGIQGKEGSAAVQASDVALTQFEFLASLLLCHGRKAYRRVATLLCFFLYKSVVVTWGYILYACVDRAQGALAYPEWLDITYNPFTSLAVLAVLVLDNDLTDKEALANPAEYWPGPSRAYLNLETFAGWMISASFHGIVCWVVPTFWLTTSDDRVHQTHVFWQASFTAYTAIILVVHLKLVLMTRLSITFRGIVAVILEVCVFLSTALLLSLPVGDKLSPELKGIPERVWASHHHMFCAVVIPLFVIMIDAIVILGHRKMAETPAESWRLHAESRRRAYSDRLEGRQQVRRQSSAVNLSVNRMKPPRKVDPRSTLEPPTAPPAQAQPSQASRPVASHRLPAKKSFFRWACCTGSPPNEDAVKRPKPGVQFAKEPLLPK
jgi:phospholipid-transporting ATPase